MANEFAKAQLEEVRAAFKEQMALIAELQLRRTQLIASGTARGKRVTVTVNADGTVIETKFTGDVSDLSYAELARAMTEAAQQAAAELARKRTELMQPLQEKRRRLPTVADLIEGMPDLAGRIPKAPPVSLAPPNSSERLQAQAAEQSCADVSEPGRPTTKNGTPRAPSTPVAARGGSVTESSWSTEKFTPDPPIPSWRR